MTPLDLKPIQNAFYWLCSYRGDNNFFGRILNSCVRQFTDTGPIAGVRVEDSGRYILRANIPRYNEFTYPLRIAIMVHEAGHLALRHYERMLRIIGSKNGILTNSKYAEMWKLLNIAGDLAVNDLAVRPLAKGSTTDTFAEVFKHLLFPERYELPVNLTLEEYFLKLMENPELREKILQSIADDDIEVNYNIFAGEGDEGEGSDADGDGTGKDSDKAALKIKNLSGGEIERLANDLQRNAREIIKSAIEQTNSCQGTIPGCMQSVIDELFTEPKIPWPLLLRNQIKSVLSNKVVPSMLMPNIALFPIICDGIEPYPGYNNDFTFRITCATDTSGSVSDEDFRIFMGEIVAIMRQYQGIELRHILFDHGIQLEEVFTRTSSDGEINEISQQIHTRHGYGGTEFCAPFRRVLGKDTNQDWAGPKPDKALSPTDLLVIFTDGFAPVSDSSSGPMPSLKPPCPVIWVICKGGQIDPAMQDIAIKIED